MLVALCGGQKDNPTSAWRWFVLVALWGSEEAEIQVGYIQRARPLTFDSVSGAGCEPASEHLPFTRPGPAAARKPCMPHPHDDLRQQTDLEFAMANAAPTLDAGTNRAIVLLKPHADNAKCEALLLETLRKWGVTVDSQQRMRGPDVDSQKLIDLHYGSLAAAAMEVQPEAFELTDTNRRDFFEQFGVQWEAARKLRNPEALQLLQCDGLQLEKMWRAGLAHHPPT